MVNRVLLSLSRGAEKFPRWGDSQLNNTTLRHSPRSSKLHRLLSIRRMRLCPVALEISSGFQWCLIVDNQQRISASSPGSGAKVNCPAPVKQDQINLSIVSGPPQIQLTRASLDQLEARGLSLRVELEPQRARASEQDTKHLESGLVARRQAYR